MTDLRPCPFCGGQPEMWDSGNVHATYKVYRVCCPNCHIVQGDMVYYNERDAANAWNTRYTEEESKDDRDTD